MLTDLYSFSVGVEEHSGWGTLVGESAPYAEWGNSVDSWIVASKGKQNPISVPS